MKKTSEACQRLSIIRGFGQRNNRGNPGLIVKVAESTDFTRGLCLDKFSFDKSNPGSGSIQMYA